MRCQGSEAKSWEWEGVERRIFAPRRAGFAPPQCPRRPTEGAPALAFSSRSRILRRNQPGSLAARRRDPKSRAAARALLARQVGQGAGEPKLCSRDWGRLQPHEDAQAGSESLEQPGPKFCGGLRALDRQGMALPSAAHSGPGDARTEGLGWGMSGPGEATGSGTAAVLIKRCSSTHEPPRRDHYIQRSLASRCRASGVRGKRDAGEGEKKEGRETRGPGSEGRGTRVPIRYANPGARAVESAPGGRREPPKPRKPRVPAHPFPFPPLSPSHPYR
ncbi:uncharacterized protein LOC125130390, partial [Phacochoerus africanus]|uniref:uncharacterized protein LOC125130390 n=1 Tax=Phacochoerus africanus TaxID=41426 RepID=UPI001FD9BB2E